MEIERSNSRSRVEASWMDKSDLENGAGSKETQLFEATAIFERPNLGSIEKHSLLKAIDYGKPLPHRQEFNQAFDEFRDILERDGGVRAFADCKAQFKQSIADADEFMERAQSRFYSELSAGHLENGKPSYSALESLQLLSAQLTGLPPGDRHRIMKELTEGDESSLADLPELKQSYDNVLDLLASGSKRNLLSSWFNYRAGLGDSIGQRLVYAGLARRFGSQGEADLEEKIVNDLKDRVGGRFLWN